MNTNKGIKNTLLSWLLYTIFSFLLLVTSFNIITSISLAIIIGFTLSAMNDIIQLLREIVRILNSDK